MRPYQILLFIAAAVPALASDRAGGYEAVMFYDIYRMDGFRSEGDRTIAVDCKGAKGGRCNFAEFISHIQPKTQTIKVNGVRTQVGKFNPASVPSTIDLDNPDINEASKIMEWKGYPNPAYGSNPKIKDPDFPSYDGKYDQKALLGKLYKADAPRDKHGDVLTKMGEVSQAGRKAGGANTDKVLSRVNTSLDNVILARSADNAENLVRDLQMMVVDKYNTGKNAANPKLMVQMTDYTDSVTGKTYKILDATRFADDIKNNPALDENAKTALNNSLTDYSTKYTTNERLSEKAGSSGVTHHRDIQAAQAISSKLKAPLPDC